MASSCKEMSTPVNTNPETQTEMCPAPLVDICMRDLLKTSVADVTTCSPDRVKWPPNGFLPCTLLPHAFAVGSNHGHHAFDQAPACALPDRGEMYSPSGLLQQWVMTGMFVRCKERTEAFHHSFIRTSKAVRNLSPLLEYQRSSANTCDLGVIGLERVDGRFPDYSLDDHTRGCLTK